MTTPIAAGPLDRRVGLTEYPKPKWFELRERDAAWWALVMGAAAALEDAANCLSDPDAKRAAEGAAKHYRTEANALWPNA